jgi:hypothetical protein
MRGIVAVVWPGLEGEGMMVLEEGVAKEVLSLSRGGASMPLASCGLVLDVSLAEGTSELMFDDGKVLETLATSNRRMRLWV